MPWEQRQDFFLLRPFEERRSGIGRCYHGGEAQSVRCYRTSATIVLTWICFGGF